MTNQQNKKTKLHSLCVRYEGYGEKKGYETRVVIVTEGGHYNDSKSEMTVMLPVDLTNRVIALIADELVALAKAESEAIHNTMMESIKPDQNDGVKQLSNISNSTETI